MKKSGNVTTISKGHRNNYFQTTRMSLISLTPSRRRPTLQGGQVFSPQRLDAAASLTALFADPSDLDYHSPPHYPSFTNNVRPTKSRRGSASNVYATPTYTLSHEDDLLQSNGLAAGIHGKLQVDCDDQVGGVKRKFPAYGTYDTPAAPDGDQYGHGGDEHNMDADVHSGRKTRKAKTKRARVNSTTSSSKKKKAKKPTKVVASGSSRKLKALGLLCARFIIMHYTQVPGLVEIKLSELSESMGIERRRMYDCLNILESIKLVAKLRKDIYIW